MTTGQRTSRTQARPGREAPMPPLSDLRGMVVRDRDGDKIGKVDGIYTDAASDAPYNVRYLAVGTGWFGTKRHVIPLEDVEWRAGNDLMLPYGREQLESAPTYDDSHELSYEDEDRIYAHYGRTGYWHAVRAKQTNGSGPAGTDPLAGSLTDSLRETRGRAGPLRADRRRQLAPRGPGRPGSLSLERNV